jgi:hypothetical protein
MAFTDAELTNFSAKAWLGVLGSANGIGAQGRAWYEEFANISSIVKPSQIWAQLASIPPAATRAQASANAVLIPTILQDLSSVGSAIHCTPSSNKKLFHATSVFGDMNTRLLNWVMPQLIPLTDGTPSIGYMLQLWNGDPATGGTEIPTVAGKVGPYAAWLVSFGDGSVLFCEDESLVVDPNDVWITGFRYIGQIGGSGGGLTPEDHRTLDQLVHNIAENNYTEYIYSGHSQITNIICWADAGKTLRIRDYAYTFTGQKITTEVVRQYNSSGAIVETLSFVYTYTGLRITNVSCVRS